MRWKAARPPGPALWRIERVHQKGWRVNELHPHDADLHGLRMQDLRVNALRTKASPSRHQTISPDHAKSLHFYLSNDVSQISRPVRSG